MRFCPEAESFDLANGGVRFVELKARYVYERLSQSLDGILHIKKPDAGIDEGKLPAVFEQ